MFGGDDKICGENKKPAASLHRRPPEEIFVVVGLSLLLLDNPTGTHMP